MTDFLPSVERMNRTVFKPWVRWPIQNPFHIAKNKINKLEKYKKNSEKCVNKGNDYWATEFCYIL